MDKFNQLYKELTRKLGGNPSRNQYAGMSIKFILEDLDKTSRLVCEDAENEGLMKLFLTKIKNGIDRAMEISLDAVVKFGEWLSDSFLVKQVFGEEETACVKADPSKYIKTMVLDGDPEKEFGETLGKRWKKQLHSCHRDFT